LQPQLGEEANFERDRTLRARVSEDIVINHWAGLLGMGCPEEELQALLKRCPEGRHHELARMVVGTGVKLAKRKESSGQRRSRPSGMAPGEWRHPDGKPLEQLKVGSTVEGVVTNATVKFGVFLDIGYKKDGKISNITEADVSLFRVGDRITNVIVNAVNVEKAFVELILTSDIKTKSAGPSGVPEAARPDHQVARGKARSSREGPFRARSALVHGRGIERGQRL